MFAHGITSPDVPVLIETLWNVKSESSSGGTGDSGSINRNIVECKDVLDILCTASVDGINRNIVECKVGIALTCLECSG